MKQIPIAFILPDLGGGGAQKVMLAIAGGLDPDRFAARILVAGGSQAFADHVPPSVPIEHGGAQRLREGMPWLVRRIRELKPAACVSVMGYLNLMLLGARGLLPSGTRIIIREANAISATTGALPGWLPGGLLYRRLYPRADAIVSPTGAIAAEIGALAPRAKPRISVIANPVDVQELRARAAPPLREPGEGLRLVSVGRLTRQKGYDRLLDLMPSIPSNAHLTVFGDGEERAALVARAARLRQEGRVRFAGFSLEAARWIAGADALLLPSRWEGLPNVALESLALGTPAIVSEQAAVRDLADEAPAGAVTIRAVDATFAEAVRAVAPSAQKQQHMAPSLLPKSYELRAVVEQWTTLVETVLSAKAEARV